MRARRTLHKEIEKCIEKVEREGSQQSFRSVIHHILEQKDYGKYGKQDFIDAVQELFFAGFDSSSSTLSSVFLYLGRHPEVLQRVREELDSAGILHCPPEDLQLSLNKIYELKYVYSVVREILRIISPVGAGYRKALKTFEVGVCSPYILLNF
jgi:cytochrome P450